MGSLIRSFVIAVLAVVGNAAVAQPLGVRTSRLQRQISRQFPGFRTPVSHTHSLDRIHRRRLQERAR